MNTEGQTEQRRFWAHSPRASVKVELFDLLSSWWHGEGLCKSAEASVKRQYNPYVAAICLATVVMKSKNYINKTFFFLSGAINHPSAYFTTCLCSIEFLTPAKWTTVFKQRPLSSDPWGSCSTNHSWVLWPPKRIATLMSHKSIVTGLRNELYHTKGNAC